MSNLNEVYGSDYQDKAIQQREDHLVELITNNLSHREFTFHLDNSENIWRGNRLSKSAIEKICQRVSDKNFKLKLVPVNLNRADHRSLIPYFIENEPCEYFYMIDSELDRFYLVFLTPSIMGAF